MEGRTHTRVVGCLVGAVGALLYLPFAARFLMSNDWLVWRRGNRLSRFAALWCLLFILPVSLFDWRVYLLDLFSESTASRYMYTADVGSISLVAVGMVPFLEAMTLVGTGRQTIITFVDSVGNHETDKTPILFRDATTQRLAEVLTPNR